MILAGFSKTEGEKEGGTFSICHREHLSRPLLLLLNALRLGNKSHIHIKSGQFPVSCFFTELLEKMGRVCQSFRAIPQFAAGPLISSMSPIDFKARYFGNSDVSQV